LEASHEQFQVYHHHNSSLMLSTQNTKGRSW